MLGQVTRKTPVAAILATGRDGWIDEKTALGISGTSYRVSGSVPESTCRRFGAANGGH